MNWTDLPLAVLAGVALCDARSRPVLFVLVLNWAASYATMPIAGHAVIIPIDIVCGLLAALMYQSEPTRRGAIVLALYPVMLLCHAAYWLLYFNGVWVGDAYYAAVLGLFALQLAVLCGPGARGYARRFGSWVRGHGSMRSHRPDFVPVRVRRAHRHGNGRR